MRIILATIAFVMLALPSWGETLPNKFYAECDGKLFKPDQLIFIDREAKSAHIKLPSFKSLKLCKETEDVIVFKENCSGSFDYLFNKWDGSFNNSHPCKILNDEPSPKFKTLELETEELMDDEPLGADVITRLKSHIQQCWNPPSVIEGASSLVVDITVELNKDGEVIKVRIMDMLRYNTDDPFRLAANAAERAFQQCSPLIPPLSPEDYEKWKTLNFRFDPRGFLN
jgi:hypothetical protein